MGKRPTRTKATTLGTLTWHSSEDEGGPDCGLELGLGGGRTLYVGELADATIRGAGQEPAGTGWWVAVTSDVDGIALVGPVMDTDVAREMVDRLFAAIQAGARRVA